MLPTANPNDEVCRDTATVYRREGYSEEVSLVFDGVDASFAPGQYALQLELYLATDKDCKQAIRVVTHHLGASPTVALLSQDANALATLTANTYKRRIFLTCPDGAVYVVVDGLLCLV